MLLLLLLLLLLLVLQLLLKLMLELVQLLLVLQLLLLLQLHMLELVQLLLQVPRLLRTPMEQQAGTERHACGGDRHATRRVHGAAWEGRCPGRARREDERVQGGGKTTRARLQRV